MRKLLICTFLVVSPIGFLSAGCDGTPEICGALTTACRLTAFGAPTCGSGLPLSDYAKAHRNGSEADFESDMRCVLRAFASGKPANFVVVKTEIEGEVDSTITVFGDGTASVQCNVADDLTCSPIAPRSFQLEDAAEIAACERSAQGEDALKACLASVFQGAAADGPVCPGPTSC
jgi:hypothetical protein